jgi:hypothetical protein
MSQAALSYHWSRDEFVRAWRAGAFDNRVELVDGEVWPVVIGSWHGDTVGQLMAVLPRSDARLTTSTLPTGSSLPDPDCWVRRADAEAVGSVGSRLQVWDPADVLLVIEVSDETVIQDLDIKARLYGRAGYPVYWVVTRDAVYEHTTPTPDGYRSRVVYRLGESIPVRYAETEILVDDLIAPQ